MSEPPSIDERLRRVAVAAHTLIEAYGDLLMRGEPREPEVAAAALSSVDDLVGSLIMTGLDAVRYDGSHVNELTRREQEFRTHVCSCPWCLRGSEAP